MSFEIKSNRRTNKGNDQEVDANHIPINENKNNAKILIKSLSVNTNKPHELKNSVTSSSHPSSLKPDLSHVNEVNTTSVAVNQSDMATKKIENTSNEQASEQSLSQSSIQKVDSIFSDIEIFEDTPENDLLDSKGYHDSADTYESPENKHQIVNHIYAPHNRALAVYETSGIPEGVDSYSEEWRLECEIRGLAMKSERDRLKMLNGIKAKRGEAAYLLLKNGTDQRISLMKALSITHPRINVEKAIQHIKHLNESERYISRNKETASNKRFRI